MTIQAMQSMFSAVFTCFSPDLGVGGGGVSQGIGTQTAYATFHPGQLKNGSLQKLVFF